MPHSSFRRVLTALARLKVQAKRRKNFFRGIRKRLED